MQSPEDPPNEKERLFALRKLALLDSPAESRFDRITRITQKMFGVDSALISLVDADRQWFKSAQGLEEAETPRDISFCGHAIGSNNIFVVNDSHEDQRFADNPLVLGGPQVRFYAGQPICAPSGEVVGTLCVLDSSPRELTGDEEQSLADLGAIVEAELSRGYSEEATKLLTSRLELVERRLATDQLTRAWSREFILTLFEKEFERHCRSSQPFSVAMLDLDHFSEINNSFGHMVGDHVLRAAADRIRSVLRRYDSLGRYGGEEFLLLLPCTEQDAALLVARSIVAAMSGAKVADVDLTVSVGVAGFTDGSATELLEAADRALIEAKSTGRNRVCFGEFS